MRLTMPFPLPTLLALITAAWVCHWNSEQRFLCENGFASIPERVVDQLAQEYSSLPSPSWKALSKWNKEFEEKLTQQSQDKEGEDANLCIGLLPDRRVHAETEFVRILCGLDHSKAHLCEEQSVSYTGLKFFELVVLTLESLKRGPQKFSLAHQKPRQICAHKRVTPPKLNGPILAQVDLKIPAAKYTMTKARPSKVSEHAFDHYAYKDILVSAHVKHKIEHSRKRKDLKKKAAEFFKFKM